MQTTNVWRTESCAPGSSQVGCHHVNDRLLDSSLQKETFSKRDSTHAGTQGSGINYQCKYFIDGYMATIVHCGNTASTKNPKHMAS